MPHWAECETPENTPAGRWHAVHTVPYPAAKLAAQAAGKVCVQQRIPAQRVFTAPDGSTVVDFGQNMAGRVEITVQAAASFCLLFGGGAGTFAVTFVIGLLVQAVLPLFAQIPMGALFANFVGGLMTAILAQGIHALIPYGSANAAIIGGIMPLLSGLAMTTAVRDTVYGDLISGMTRALEALLLAAAAAMGVYVGLKFAAMMGGIAL